MTSETPEPGRHPDAYPYGEPWGPGNPAPGSPWNATWVCQACGDPVADSWDAFDEHARACRGYPSDGVITGAAECTADHTPDQPAACPCGQIPGRTTA